MVLANGNPWTEICSSRNAYVLEQDRSCVERHNSSCTPETKFVLESIPEPFIGNPETARVVLLGKNPGHADDDLKSYQDAGFREAMFRNLRHERQEYPFYPLNPAFKQTGAGSWWREHTCQLREKYGVSDRTLATRLMVIEWFPYHSIKFKRPKEPCFSQHYSFQLARKMLSTEDILVIRMRGKNEWDEVFTDVSSDRLRALKNPQRCYITQGNMEGDLFQHMLKALGPS
jgi:hypothetical protein